VRFAILGLVLLVFLLIAGLLATLEKLDKSDAQYRQLYELYVVPKASLEDDAQAIRNHQALADQYRAMIDELYEQGEQIAFNKDKRRVDRCDDGV
jgi:hypothetical protein